VKIVNSPSRYVRRRSAASYEEIMDYWISRETEKILVGYSNEGDGCTVITYVQVYSRQDSHRESRAFSCNRNGRPMPRTIPWNHTLHVNLYIANVTQERTCVLIDG